MAHTPHNQKSSGRRRASGHSRVGPPQTARQAPSTDTQVGAKSALPEQQLLSSTVPTPHAPLLPSDVSPSPVAAPHDREGHGPPHQNPVQ